MTSHSLYKLYISLMATTERRLQIDLAVVREAYEIGDVTGIVWIKSSSNPADDVTKTSRRSKALATIILTKLFSPVAES